LRGGTQVGAALFLYARIIFRWFFSGYPRVCSVLDMQWIRSSVSISRCDVLPAAYIVGQNTTKINKAEHKNEKGTEIAL
jgi:hypothetical protein